MVNDSTDPFGVRALVIPGVVSAAFSVLVNVSIVLVIGSLNIAPGFRPLSVPPVVFLTVLGAGAAVMVYGLLGRIVVDVDRVFLRIAGVLLILSFVPDIALLVVDSSATVLGVVVLMIMHVVVAGMSVGFLVYWDRF